MNPNSDNPSFIPADPVIPVDPYANIEVKIRLQDHTGHSEIVEVLGNALELIREQLGKGRWVYLGGHRFKKADEDETIRQKIVESSIDKPGPVLIHTTPTLRGGAALKTPKAKTPKAKTVKAAKPKAAAKAPKSPSVSKRPSRSKTVKSTEKLETILVLIDDPYKAVAGDEDLFRCVARVEKIDGVDKRVIYGHTGAGILTNTAEVSTLLYKAITQQ